MSFLLLLKGTKTGLTWLWALSYRAEANSNHKGEALMESSMPSEH